MKLLFCSFSIFTCINFINGVALAEEVNGEVSDGKSTLTKIEIVNELIAAPDKIRTISLSNKKELISLLTPALLDKRIAEQAENEGFSAQSDVKQAMARSARSTLVRLYITSKLAEREKNFGNLDALAYESYLNNKSAYVVPESMHFAHILVVVDPENENQTEEKGKKRAELIMEKLKSGADFAVVAKDQSDDKGSAAAGGDIGWVPRGVLVPPLDKVAYTLKPGAVSGIVRTRYGFDIIKALEYRASYTKPFDEVKAELVNAVKQTLINHERDELLSKYRGPQELHISDLLFKELKSELKVEGHPNSK